MSTSKQETIVSVTVWGIEEHIPLDGAHPVKEARSDRKVDANTRLDTLEGRLVEVPPVEYDDATYLAVGKHFVEKYRTLVDVHDVVDEDAEKAIAADRKEREDAAAKADKATVKA